MPLPWACRFTGGMLVLLLATALAAGFAKAWGLAVGWLLMAALLAVGARRDLWLRGADAPVALVLSPERGLIVETRRGSRDPVTLASSSLFLASGAMLVLTGRSKHRLFLGSGNVNPDQLAALRRLLRGLRA